MSKRLSVLSITKNVREISTLQISAFTKNNKKARKITQKAKIKDYGAFFIGFISTIIGGYFVWYYYTAHQLLIYNDASSHLRIARGVFDNVTPGLAQLGSVWLPLPQVLYIPFVGNDYLWTTGLAGTFISYPCFIISSIYIYLLAKKITKKTYCGIVASVFFFLNPNVIYLQATAMTELLSLCLTIITIYYFYCWYQKRDSLKLLTVSAISICLLTVTRYEGWMIFIIMNIIIISFFKEENNYSATISRLIYFNCIASIGIISWFFWNKIIWGDFLYFQNGPYSAQHQQQEFLSTGNLSTYHNIFESIKIFSLLLFQTFGIFGLIISLFGLIMFLFFGLNKKTFFFLLILISPTIFYIISLYTGQIVIDIPIHNPNEYFNVRYGLVVIFPLCFLSGYIVYFEKKTLNNIILIFSLICIIFQSSLLSGNKNISLRDGEVGGSCSHSTPAYIYLTTHYDLNPLLEDASGSHLIMADLGVDLKHTIYQGSGIYWNEALVKPSSVVTWVIFTSSKSVINKTLETNEDLKNNFEVVYQDGPDDKIYHLKSVPIKVHAPFPLSTWTDRSLCK